MGQFTNQTYLEEKDVSAIFDAIDISPVALQQLLVQDRFLNITRGSGIGGRIVEEDIVGLPCCADVSPTMSLSNIETETPEINIEVLAEQIKMSHEREQQKQNEALEHSILQKMQEVEVDEAIPVAGTRKIISERMMQSLQSTAQLSVTMQASAKKLKATRAKYKAGNIPITINDIILHVVARVLFQHPWANSIMVGDKIISYKHVNLGFATQTPKGLMVPVIQSAEEKSIEELALAAKELALECKEGSIAPSKLQSGTFTVSNLGAYGVQSFTPILNAPQTGILGVGGIDVRAIEKGEGEYMFEPCITLSLTFDHRAYDGALAAELLQNFVQAINECNIDTLNNT